MTAKQKTLVPPARALLSSFHSSWAVLFILSPCKDPLPSASRHAIALSPVRFSTTPLSAAAPSASAP